MSTTVTDPVTLEIHRRSLENITTEAAIALTRTSGSPIIYEVQDFATSLLDPGGEQLSMSLTLLFHAGSSLLGTRAIIDLLGPGTEPEPGDGWIVNDPFAGGAMHQGDVAIITPQFYEDAHVGWSFANVHVLDVGGSGVSGFAPGATSVYEEGLRFPATKIIRDGTIDPEWERYIAANVRIAPLVLNDIRGMIAANNVSQEKLTETIGRFGLERHRELCEASKDLTEATLRNRIERLPDGTYETVEWVEFDGHGEQQLLELRCRLQILGTEMRFCFGGAPQVEAFVNGTSGLVYGSVMTVLLTTLGYGDLPFNAGMWRPLEIDLGPGGSIVNAAPPAPVSAAHATLGTRVSRACRSVLNQALSLSADPRLRERVAGLSSDAAAIAPLAGLGHGGVPSVVFLVDQMTGIGGGAQTLFDGQECRGPEVAVGVGLPSVETTEGQHPALYLWRRTSPNSGGPGLHRGGLALESAYMPYDTERLTGAVIVIGSDVPAAGAGGGLPGSASGWEPWRDVDRGEALRRAAGCGCTGAGAAAGHRSHQSRFSIGPADVLQMRGGGGGGAGDPLLRDPERVAFDLLDGVISAGHARAAYGVVVGAGGEVDAEATERLRHQARRARIGAEPAKVQQPPRTPGVAVVLEREGERAEWACAYCGASLGRAASNWRDAAVSRLRPLAERYAELEMAVRELADLKMTLAEHHCPACAGLLGAEAFPAGFAGYPAPRLAEVSPTATQTAKEE